jgi:hypothetical protein
MQCSRFARVLFRYRHSPTARRAAWRRRESRRRSQRQRRARRRRSAGRRSRSPLLHGLRLRLDVDDRVKRTGGRRAAVSITQLRSTTPAPVDRGRRRDRGSSLTALQFERTGAVTSEGQRSSRAAAIVPRRSSLRFLADALAASGPLLRCHRGCLVGAVWSGR